MMDVVGCGSSVLPGTKRSFPAWMIRANSMLSSALAVDSADPKTGLEVDLVAVSSMSRWRESRGESSGSITGIVTRSSSGKECTSLAISS